MKANYFDHTALEDDLIQVYLIIQVPDGRILLYKNPKARVPRFPNDWQCTLSKSLIRGKKNKSALEDIVFANFGWNREVIEEADFILRFGFNHKTIFVYKLSMDKRVVISPGTGASVFALPWGIVVNQVKNKQMEFTEETSAIVDVLSYHKIGDF